MTREEKNKKLDALRLTPRRPTHWGKGFVIPPRKTDMDVLEMERRIACARFGVRK